jgi:hypothetical protein
VCQNNDKYSTSREPFGEGAARAELSRSHSVNMVSCISIGTIKGYTRNY